MPAEERSEEKSPSTSATPVPGNGDDGEDEDEEEEYADDFDKPAKKEAKSTKPAYAKKNAPPKGGK